MKIGVSLFPGRYPIDAAVMAEKAEAPGFDSLWVGEHPIMPVQSTSLAPGSSGSSIPDFYSQLVDPFVALARASAVTTTLKLGTGVTLVPERNPLLLAKEVATLDYFSRGRFLFGIGAGWNKEETEIMGAISPTAGRRRAECPCFASAAPACRWHGSDSRSART